MNSSFVSTYSMATNTGGKNQNNDCYLFQNPSFIYGQTEWTFGKHFFQVDTNLIENEYCKANQSYICYMTVGLLCSIKRNEKEISDQDEKVIIGCKVNVKEHCCVQVFLNLEKHILLCVANGKVQEKFDLS